MTVAELSERLAGLPGTMKIRFQVAEQGLSKADCGFVTNAEPNFDNVANREDAVFYIEGIIDDPGSAR